MQCQPAACLQNVHAPFAHPPTLSQQRILAGGIEKVAGVRNA